MQQPVYNHVHSNVIVNASIQLLSGEKLEVSTVVPLMDLTPERNERGMEWGIVRACDTLRNNLRAHLKPEPETEG